MELSLSETSSHNFSAHDNKNALTSLSRSRRTSRGILLPRRPYASKEAFPLLNNKEVDVSSLQPIIQELGRPHREVAHTTDAAYLCSTHIAAYCNSGVSTPGKDNPNSYLGSSDHWLPANDDVVTWNKAITYHANKGNALEAFNVFTKMLCQEIEPTRVTFICMVKACSSTRSKELAKRVNACAVMYGLEWATFVANTLIDTYAKCGSLDDALILFHRCPEQDIVSWNVLISSWPKGESHQLVHKMKEAGIEPDHVTYVAMLKECTSIKDLKHSWQVHCLVVENGLEFESMIGGTLIDMYAKHGEMDHAHRVFNRLPEHNVVMWSALISGYVQQRLDDDALLLFKRMQKEGVSPNSTTFCSVFKACSSLGCLDKGNLTYDFYMKSGLELDPFVGSSLIDMYIKCRKLDDARAVFNRMPSKNVVAWSSLIGGYAEHGMSLDALRLFRQMQATGLEADEVTFVYVLRACSNSAALEEGREIHALVLEKGLEANPFVGSTLIYMYGKLTCTEDSLSVFERIPRKDVVTWSALIGSFGQLGDSSSAMGIYRRMEEAAVNPDGVTFSCLLAACSRSGSVKVGNNLLNSMVVDYCIAPTCAHYNLLIDLYCNADHLCEAEDLLETMPYDDNAEGWLSLLDSCRGRLYVELGRRCFDQISRKGDSCAFMLMSEMYIEVGMPEEARKIEELRKSAYGWKNPGDVFIEADEEVQDITVGDGVHLESREIASIHYSLTKRMEDYGHKPCLDLVLGSLAEARKGDGDSEKLAMAFGLIHTPDGAT